MKLLNVLLVFSSMLPFLSGCGKNVAPQNTGSGLTAPFDLSRLANKRIQSLLVVIFAKDYDEQSWATIFKETNHLSLNLKQMRALSSSTADSDVRQFSELQDENANLLLDLGGWSLFLMDWAIESENCKFGAETLFITCSPFTFDNPLNGGLPIQKSSVSWVIPDPVKEDTKTPYLDLTLSKVGAPGMPTFNLKLQLEVEQESQDTLWLKGEVIPMSGSKFLDPSGKLTSDFYVHGYSEMVLVP